MSQNIILAALLAVVISVFIISNQTNNNSNNGSDEVVVFDPRDAVPVENVYGAFTAKVMISTSRPVQTSIFMNPEGMALVEEGQSELEDNLSDVAVVEGAIGASDLGNKFFDSNKSPLSSSQTQKNLVAAGALFAVPFDLARNLSTINNLAKEVSGFANQRIIIESILSNPLSRFFFFSVFSSPVGQGAAIPGNTVNEILMDQDMMNFADRTDKLRGVVARKRGINLSRNKETSSKDYVKGLLSKFGGRSLYGAPEKDGSRSITTFSEALEVALNEGLVLTHVTLESEESDMNSSRSTSHNRKVYPKVYLFASKDRSNTRNGRPLTFGTW